MQTPEICICASARGPKVGLQCSGPRANHVPVPEPNSDKRHAWAINADHCTLLVRGAALGELEAEGTPSQACFLWPLSILLPKPMMKLAVVQPAQVFDVAHCGQSKRERKKKLSSSLDCNSHRTPVTYHLQH